MNKGPKDQTFTTLGITKNHKLHLNLLSEQLLNEESSKPT